MRRMFGFTGVLLASALSGAATSPTVGTTFGKPFWEGKPKLETKLRDERAILVSVRTDKGEKDPGADLFTINGVGWVKRDAETVFQLARQFDKLKDVSDHFREVKYDPKTSRVFVICEALGYQARMLLEVTSTLAPVREIQFKVVDGHFLGLEGVMGFREIAQASPVETEVSLRVRHEAREIPIPRMLVGFALEVLVQQVAQAMRTHFESAAAPLPEIKKAPETAPVKNPNKKSAN